MRVVAERVVLVRHGETSWSTLRKHTGRTDVPLDDDGVARARRLRPILAAMPGVSDATVLCSPLLRARQTCELAGLGGRSTIDDDLVEWDYGEFEGTVTAELRASEPSWSIWTATITQGETLDDVGGRVDAVLGRLADVGGVVVLFAHAHVLRILAARWCGFPAIAGSRLTLLPASISVLGFEREVPVIDHWNVDIDTSPAPPRRV